MAATHVLNKSILGFLSPLKKKKDLMFTMKTHFHEVTLPFCYFSLAFERPLT